ncbi:hypothetical protein [Streptomyces carpaticus]|uniref:hypothetical protein n=1 Tax=Streptomyces carpaticus TaxID=285558 RepID=UPI0031F817AD
MTTPEVARLQGELAAARQLAAAQAAVLDAVQVELDEWTAASLGIVRQALAELHRGRPVPVADDGPTATAHHLAHLRDQAQTIDPLLAAADGLRNRMGRHGWHPATIEQVAGSWLAHHLVHHTTPPPA